MVRRDLFEKRFRQLVYVTKQKDPDSEISFSSGLWYAEEGYKLKFWHEARKQMELDSWNRKTDQEIVSLATQPFGILMGESYQRQNLVSDSNYSRLFELFVERRSEAAAALKEIFFGDDEKAAFEMMAKLLSGKHLNDPLSVISLYFFLKDKDRYVTARKQGTSERINRLGVSAACVQNCVWSGYQEYLEIVREIKEYLPESLQASFLDAQSFLWMLWMVNNDTPEAELKQGEAYSFVEDQTVRTEYVREEKALKKRILLSVRGDREGISFAALFRMFSMTEEDRGYLHILLLDLCRDGFLQLSDGQSGPLDQMMFSAGDEKLISQYLENADSAKKPVSAVNTERTETSEKQASAAAPAMTVTVERRTEEVAEAEVADESVKEDAGETDSRHEIVTAEYADTLYRRLVRGLKSGGEWKSVRELLACGAWPKEKEVCSVLPALLIQMASEGKVEIRTEKDRISGVRPSVRYREGCEQISGAILAVLSSIPSPEAAEVPEVQEAEPEQPVKAENIQDQIPEELFAVVADEDSEQKDNAAEEEADGIPKEEESISEKEEPEDGETDVSSDEGEADTAVGTDGEDVPDDDWQERAQVPYGYRDTPNGFAIVESEAEVVRAIFKMRSRKMILQAIADHLNELGIGSKTGKQFYAATVGDILRKFKLYQGKKMSRGWFFPAILDDHFLERYNPISDKKEETAVTTEEKKPEESAGARAVPYGYEYVDKEIRIEPLEAECVRALFEMYDRGDPRSSLIGKLFARGYRGRDGHGITQGLVMEILGNRQLYTGSTGYPAILKENALKPEPEQQHEEPVKTETEPEKKPEQASVVESVQAPATQEEIQEEIYGVLYENPGFHSIEAIKSLSAKLKLLPDFKIIFNANILKSRNLIDEILTSPPDVVMYLYASKVQAPVQQAVQDTAPEASIDVKPQAELSKDRDVLDFLEYCRVTPMSYAYKMILIMAFIKHANDMGNMHIDDAVQFFRQYYDDRRSRGLKVEKGNTIFADPGAATRSMRRNIIDNPVRALKSGGYFTYDSRNEMLSLRHFVWSKLNERDKEEIVNICQNRLKEYFGEI